MHKWILAEGIIVSQATNDGFILLRDSTMSIETA